MSLINQVLKDLDERRTVEYSENKTELHGLHFAHTPKPANRSQPYLIGAVVTSLLIVMVITGVYFYNQFVASPVDVVETESSDKVVVAARSENKVASSEVKTAKPETTTTTPAVTSRSERPRAPVEAPKVKHQVSVQATSVSHDTDRATAPVKERSEQVQSEPEESDLVADDTPVKFTRNTVPMRAEQKAELAYQNGYDHLRAKRHRQAERWLRQALAVEPGHIKARELLSGIYIKQGRWVEASELLQQGVNYSPQHITFTKLYARALMQLNDDQKAIKVLKQRAPAIESDPDYFAILAALYQRQAQHQQAADIYARLVTINSQNGVWWVGMGISLEALGRKQDAARAYGHARKTGNLHQEVARFTNNRLLALDEINFPAE